MLSQAEFPSPYSGVTRGSLGASTQLCLASFCATLNMLPWELLSPPRSWWANKLHLWVWWGASRQLMPDKVLDPVFRNLLRLCSVSPAPSVTPLVFLFVFSLQGISSFPAAIFALQNTQRSWARAVILSYSLHVAITLRKSPWYSWHCQWDEWSIGNPVPWVPFLSPGGPPAPPLLWFHITVNDLFIHILAVNTQLMLGRGGMIVPCNTWGIWGTKIRLLSQSGDVAGAQGLN